MLLTALPWMLAAGLFGITPAAVMGLGVGIFQSLWLTHNLFTPLEIALLAILFSAGISQRYRTKPFRMLEHPVIAAACLALVYPLINLLVLFFSSSGTVVERLDYTFTYLLSTSLTVVIPLLIGGGITEIISRARSEYWGNSGPLTVSPIEKSLKSRLIYYMIPIALVLILSLVLGNWIVANKAAQDIVKTRMSDSVESAEENLNYFLESGSSQIYKIASDDRLISSDTAEVHKALQGNYQDTSFFNELIVYDANGSVISRAGIETTSSEFEYEAENEGITYVLQNTQQTIETIPAGEEMLSARVSFIVPLYDENKVASRVLAGRSNFYSNPIGQQVWNALKKMAEFDGQGMLIDENNRILIHPDPAFIFTIYSGPISEGYIQEKDPSQELSPENKPQLVYFSEMEGSPWVFILSVPVQQLQKSTLEIIAPMLLVIAVISIAVVATLLFGVRVISGSLESLARVAGRISEGRLNYPLSTKGADEIGQLRRSFERMRSSLKDRLEELNRLLEVSQGVASSLEFSTAVEPVLTSALSLGASSARVVLKPDVLPELGGSSSEPITQGAGSAKDLYSDLDPQILYFIGQQDQLERLVLPDVKRPRLFDLPNDAPNPASLLAVALRHDNSYYGVLWIAYDEHHEFSEEEVRFLITLGGQAALAAANAHLYLQSEIERQRLDAILSSSPDPVLVTDQNNRLMVANPAAWQVLQIGIENDSDQLIEEILPDKELVNLMLSTSEGIQSKEIGFPDGEVYLATATTVISQDVKVGRVCILRDITALKELDTLKSEFVSTVSHDLRSPLTLMRGYATMLEMVGELNEQQENYVQKIVEGVESMTHLVNNLLDLGRIELGIALNLELISAGELVNQLVSSLKLQAIQKRIELVTEFEDDLPEVEADKALLQQALHNLIENGIKFSQSEGKVAISAKSSHKNMIFRVHDSGIGISPMDQQHLFEKFNRLTHKSSEDKRGSGLGLAIVKSIAERHHGSVKVKSQLGKGSSFFLELPLRQPSTE